MKKIKRVTVDSGCSVIDLIDKPISEVIAALNDIQQSIPDGCQGELETEWYHDCPEYGVYYCREETDEEYSKRLDSESSQAKLRVDYERLKYEELKRKFEGE